MCIGLGAGVFGHGLGELISRQTVKNNPEIQADADDQQDERNQMIANKAKGSMTLFHVFADGHHAHEC
ncbi:MAG: hypothetical protein ACLSA6_08405 [Holdemania massiliensis]